MPFCTINRYYHGNNTDHEFVLPGHVTLTGNEDHHALAVHDARMIMQGMKAADEISIKEDAGEDRPRYRLHSVRLD